MTNQKPGLKDLSKILTPAPHVSPMTWGDFAFRIFSPRIHWRHLCEGSVVKFAGWGGSVHPASLLGLLQLSPVDFQSDGQGEQVQDFKTFR